MGEAARQVGQAMYWSVLSRAGRFALGLASSIIIVRTLGKHDYGVLSLLRVVLIFVAILAGAGMGQSLLKFLPMLKVAGDRAGARRVILWVIAVQAAAWALLLVASYLLAGWFESLFSFEGAGKILYIAVALEIFEIAFKLVSQVLTAYYDVRLLSVAGVAGQAVFVVFLAIFLPAGWGVVGVFAATALGNLASTVMVAKRVLAYLGSSEPGPELARTTGGARGAAAGDASGSQAAGAARSGASGAAVGVDWGRLLRFSFPFAIIGVFNVIVWRQSETIFLARFRGAAEAGFFDLAYRLPQTVLEFIPLTVWPIIMAGVSEVYAKDRTRLATAIDRYYRMLFLLSAPICVVGATLGGRMIPILYGDAMSPAALPTQLFFVIFTISFFGTPLSMALYVIERSHTNLLVYALLAIVNVGLDLLLIPRYGVVGAIIPVGLVIAGSPFLYKFVLARYVPGVRIPFRFIGKCFLASSPVLVMLPFTRLIDGVFELCAAFVAACVLILIAAKKVKLLGREEMDMLGAVPVPSAHRLLKLLS